MGSFSSLLGGLATGARDEYSKIDEANRASKRAKDKSIADAILKDLQTNEQLTPDEQENHFRTFLDLNGVKDKKVVEGLINHSQYHRNKMAEFERQQGYNKQQPQLGGDQQTAPETTVAGADGAPDVTLPAMPMAPTAGLPQLPPPPSGFQPKTTGQLKFEESEPRVRQAENDKQAAIRQEALDAKLQGFEGSMAFIKKYEGTPEEGMARQLAGAAPKGVGAKSRALAGTMSGAAVIKELDAQGKDSSGINPTSSYRASVDADGKVLPDSIHETEQPTRAGTASLGSYWIKMFPTDASGSPVVENSMYVPIRTLNGGRIINVIPVTELGSQRIAQNYKTVTMLDGSPSLVPVTEVSATVKTAGGQPIQNGPGVTPANAQVAGPVPSSPGTPNTRPASVARPTPGQPIPRSATPSTPLPSRGVGATIAIPGAGRPLTAVQKQHNEQVAEMLNNSIGGIKDLLEPDSQKVLASMFSAGKIQMQVDPQQGFWRSIINKNMSLTPQETQVAADWQLLSEGVLQMRLPMGGAGFRGPEGFGAIESNRGILSQHPEIITRVLNGTLREFRAQRDPLVKDAPKYGYDVKPELTSEDIRKIVGALPKKNPFRK